NLWIPVVDWTTSGALTASYCRAEALPHGSYRALRTSMKVPRTSLCIALTFATAVVALAQGARPPGGGATGGFRGQGGQPGGQVPPRGRRRARRTPPTA